MSIKNVTHATKLIQEMTKTNVSENLKRAEVSLSEVKKAGLSLDSKKLIVRNLNRIRSLHSAVEDGEIKYSEVKAELSSFEEDMRVISHNIIEHVTSQRTDTVQAASGGKVVLKDFSELSRLLKTLEPVTTRIKAVEKANGVESDWTDGEKRAWEEYDASQNAYDEAMHQDAANQKAKIDSHAAKLPTFAKISNDIKNGGFSIFKAPLLIVFTSAPKVSATRRARVNIEHLSIGSHLAEKIKNDPLRLGSIVSDQLVLALPSALVKDKDKFEEEKKFAVSALANRLGEIVCVSKSPMTVEKIRRATETHKVSFAAIPAPKKPVVPTAPMELNRKDSKDPKLVKRWQASRRQYEKAKVVYDEEMVAYKAALKKYNSEVKQKDRNLKSVHKKEAAKLGVVRDEYFLSKLYPGYVFVWLMPASVYSALMPMRFATIAFPTTDETAPEEYKEVSKTKKLHNDLLVPAQQSLKAILGKIKTVKEDADKKVGKLTSLEVALNNAAKNMAKLSPSSPLYSTQQNVIAGIRSSIATITKQLEDVHATEIPNLLTAVREIQNLSKQLVDKEK